MLKTKKCKQCKEVKDIKDYYKNPDGNLLSYCKKCHNFNSTKNHKKRGYFKTTKGKEAWNMASKKAYKKHFKKWMCRAKTRYYVKIGKLIKPVMCEMYSPHPKVPCYGKIEAHHKC